MSGWLPADREPEGEPVPMAYVARHRCGGVLILQADTREGSRREFLEHVGEALALGQVTLSREPTAPLREAPWCECERPVQEALW